MSKNLNLKVSIVWKISGVVLLDVVAEYRPIMFSVNKLRFFSKFSFWHDSWPARKRKERKEPRQKVLPSGFATPATRAWLLTISPRESFLAGYVIIIEDLKQQECRLPGRQNMASGKLSIVSMLWRDKFVRWVLKNIGIPICCVRQKRSIKQTSNFRLLFITSGTSAFWLLKLSIASVDRNSLNLLK